MSVAHSQSFDLVEHHLRAGCDLFVAVAFAGQDHTNGFGIVVTHGTDLAGAGVGAQEDIGNRCVEGVLHLPGRMSFGEIEQLEIHLVRFDITCVVNLETHVSEDVVDFAQGAADRVDASHLWSSPGQGHIDTFRCEFRLQIGFFHSLLPFLKGSSTTSCRN